MLKLSLITKQRKLGTQFASHLRESLKYLVASAGLMRYPVNLMLERVAS